MDKTITLKSDKNLFGKLIYLSQKKNLDMADVLKHALSPLPYELANADGSIRKNNKFSLATAILKDISSNVTVKQQSFQSHLQDGTSKY